MVLLVFAGLTAGTFYPLTLSFALRNIPIRYLALTLALYAMRAASSSWFGWQRPKSSQ